MIQTDRWYRNRKCEEQFLESRTENIGTELLAIRKFSDQLCVGLAMKGMIGRGSARQVVRRNMFGQDKPDDSLQRITKDGTATREPTDKTEE